MKTTDILSKIDKAVADLIKNEKRILARKLSERILSNHLADYLRPLFSGFNVDPEYNGDIDKPNDRKALEIAADRMKAIGYKPNAKNVYKLSPDIIIHKQETNEKNLVVIEVKKDVSPDKDKAYDLIKLEHLTIDYLGNHYNYKLGIAITFGTGKNSGSFTEVYFQKGIKIEDRNLLE